MRLHLPSKVLFILPVALTLFILAYWLFGSNAPHALFREDGPIEIISATCYLASAVICVVALLMPSQVPKVYFLLWAFLALMFFGEEMSWLQRVFGFETPAIMAEVNKQDEFNIHNLKWFPRGELLGARETGAGLTAVLAAQNLFRLGFVFYFLLLPLLFYLPFGQRLNRKLLAPYPGGDLLLYIWVPIAVSAALAVITTGAMKSGVAETREMFYAISILTYTGLMARSARDDKPSGNLGA